MYAHQMKKEQIDIRYSIQWKRWTSYEKMQIRMNLKINRDVYQIMDKIWIRLSKFLNVYYQSGSFTLIYVYTKQHMHVSRHQYSWFLLDLHCHLFWTIHKSRHLLRHRCSALETLQMLLELPDSQWQKLIHTKLQSHFHPYKWKMINCVN